MKFYPLEFETAMEKDALYCLEIGYADLTAATNTQTLSPINIDANQGFYVTSAELVTPFVSSDSTLKSTAITIGDSGSANRFLASMECNTANTPVYMQPGALANTSEPYLYTAAAAVTALRNLELAILPVDEALGVRAGELFALTKSKGLSLGDRICLALAEREGLTVLTTDRAWAELDLDIKVELIR